jgi:hypothetical protein
MIQDRKIYQTAAKFEFNDPKMLVKIVRKEEMKRLGMKDQYRQSLKK